jgi:putative tricarboxylic transport membrane protein
VPELEAGVLRAIAISSPSRLSGAYVSTPTWKEQGADCIIGSWRGASGPPGLDASQVAFWETTLRAATRTAEWQTDLARHLWTEMYLDGFALRDFLARERADTRTVLGGLGLLNG